ncbi:cache domain-containing protein [Candidatus Chloroploca sp. Khr17]|uniref:PDC sensor domain-containing protein n=1 Tax=Candidatus Chloroploca sp. Khr17 TaxID=2496869 RepID=UPI00101DD063|nr:cache domain-containing protein [Candidatus Chloroploca sp. Khr17]
MFRVQPGQFEVSPSKDPGVARRVRWVLLVSTVVLVLLALFLAIRFLVVRAQVSALALETARTEAQAAATTIDVALLRAQTLAVAIGDDLAAGSLAYAEVPERLQALLAAEPELDGVAVTCEPFACDPNLRLTQVYAFRDANQGLGLLEGATYDYTLPPQDDLGAPATGWYYDPIREGAQWSEPFLATGAAKVLIEYGTPFARLDPADPAPAGLVTVDFSTQGMRRLMANLELGGRGYGFIVTADGTFLSHPDIRFVARRSIFDPASGYDAAVQAAVRRALAGEMVELAQPDAVTGREAWFFLVPLESNGGVVGVVIDAADMAPPAEATLRNLVALGLTLGGLMVLLTALVVRVEHGGRRELWLLALVFTGVCVGLIGLTWRLSALTRDQASLALTSPATVERMVERYREGLHGDEQPFVVPTGIELTALQFPTPTTVTINALIWQRYADTIPEEVERGFALSQTIGELLPIEEAARVREGDGELIVWRVGIVLQQRFDPLRFPFDTRAVEVWLQPAELDENVMLTPDLEAYPLLRPSALPGVGEAIWLNQWELENSYFTLREGHEGASLGLSRRADRLPPPELFFTLTLQRQVVGPFIAYLLPGMVTLVLVFAFLMSDRQISDRQDLVAALSYAAALFFVIALAHTALRENVAAIGITYLEHLYLLLYLIVVAVIFDAFLLVRAPNLPLITYGDHLLPKLLYWPFCAFAMLVSTLVIFV